MMRRIVMLALAMCGTLRGAWALEVAGATCDLKAVTCGGAFGTFAGFEGCTFVRVGKIGESEPDVGVQITAFVGVKIEGKVLFLGGASFEKSLRLTCIFGPADKHPSAEQMKLALRKMVASNPEVRKQYPDIEKFEFAKDFKFKSVSEQDFTNNGEGLSSGEVSKKPAVIDGRVIRNVGSAAACRVGGGR